jgi:hypothetical protein
MAKESICAEGITLFSRDGGGAETLLVVYDAACEESFGGTTRCGCRSFSDKVTRGGSSSLARDHQIRNSKILLLLVSVSLLTDFCSWVINFYYVCSVNLLRSKDENI